jgi:5-oxopent-3-ene-1,2,5-tricarboxylate decarboxylase/2-hydroxyhepta-2,4-diene-1,7-dioate isomerase
MTEAPRSVIGVALNFAASQPPPQAPVLYLKTPNTWIKPGDHIPCPSGLPGLRCAGTLGIVISRHACRVAAGNAFDFIAGFTVVNDVSIPHDSLFRPAIRQRCFDASCAIGETCPQINGQSAFEIGVVINNVLRSVANTSALVRSIPSLIQDISEFMTLREGDILLVGEPETSPVAHPGDNVRVEIPGVGAIENRVVAA